MATLKTRGRWNWLWLNVTTRTAAESATKGAFWAAIACAASSFFLANLVQASGAVAYFLFSGALSVAIAFGLAMHSRLAAWAGLVLYIGARAYDWSIVGIKPSIITPIFVFAFIGGVRGTSALRRFNRIELGQPKSEALC